METTLTNFFVSHLHPGGYYALFIMTFLETSALVGLLVPGESIVVIAGLLAARGNLDLTAVIGIAIMGAVLGDTVGYFIGSRFGEPFFLRWGHLFFFKREYLDQAKEAFLRYGGKIVFLGRFMAWLRAFAPVVAGISRMPYRRFLFFNAAGGIAWAVAFSLIGFFLGKSWDIIRIYLGRVGIAAFVAGLALLYLYSVLNKKQHLIRERLLQADQKLTELMPDAWPLLKDRFRAGRWYGLNLTISLAVLILAFMSFGEIVEDLIDREALFVLDFKMQSFVGGLATPALTKGMVAVTSLGSLYLLAPVVMFLALYLLFVRNWWDLFALFIATGFGQSLLVLLKLFFHRIRPVPQLALSHGFSFPSGHSFSSIIIYGFLMYIAWRAMHRGITRTVITAALSLLILSIGMSRIYLNVHWTTDVMAGFAFGLAWLIMSIIMAKTMQEMTRTQK
ncbi:MAG: bifunctional DedA family/phosphatase PAP2 family protein [Syntrophales bacterium]|nr:bifunctional DedA family/phosphatase PAP2 family protein [Syntrophales bacterium]